MDSSGVHKDIPSCVASRETYLHRQVFSLDISWENMLTFPEGLFEASSNVLIS